jgi:hypothetical protein
MVFHHAYGGGGPLRVVAIDGEVQDGQGGFRTGNQPRGLPDDKV